MPRLQIELDVATNEALTSLAGARGTTPADLAAEIVEQYVQTPPPQTSTDLLDADASSEHDHADDEHRASPGALDQVAGRYTSGRFVGDPPDPLDAIVGSVDADPVEDIDEVIYGR